MIFCFSGCGNTAAVARALASGLPGERVYTIEASAPRLYDASTQQRIVWCFPVHSWGVPKAVLRFIAEVQIDGADRLDHYMVATCGDDAGLTDRMWRKALRQRGWHGSAAHTVIMPNTYVSLPGFDVDSPSLTEEKLKAAPARITKVAKAIKCRSRIDLLTRGRFAWFKTKVIYPLFMRFLTSPAPFNASDDCNGCGTCARNCPLANITMHDSRPQWSDNCTLCMGCYHRCPRHCISYGRATRGKGHYAAPQALNINHPES